MDRVLISWNVPNWITVLLMVGLGYLTIALIAQLLGVSDNFNVKQWFGTGRGMTGVTAG